MYIIKSDNVLINNNDDNNNNGPISECIRDEELYVLSE